MALLLELQCLLYCGIIYTRFLNLAIQKDPAGFVPDNIWEASSYLKKYDDKYNLILSVKDGKSGACREATLVKSVANFIDENGTIVYELLEPEISKLHNILLLSDHKDK